MKFYCLSYLIILEIFVIYTTQTSVSSHQYFSSLQNNLSESNSNNDDVPVVSIPYIDASSNISNTINTSSTCILTDNSSEVEIHNNSWNSECNHLSKNYPKPKSFLSNKNFKLKQNDQKNERLENPKLIKNNELKESKEYSRKYLGDILIFQNSPKKEKHVSMKKNETDSKTKKDSRISMLTPLKTEIIKDDLSSDKEKSAVYENFESYSDSSSDLSDYLETSRIYQPLIIKCQNVYMRPYFEIDLNKYEDICPEIKNKISIVKGDLIGLDETKDKCKKIDVTENNMLHEDNLKDFDLKAPLASSETDDETKINDNSKNNLIDFETNSNTENVEKKLKNLEEKNSIISDDYNESALKDIVLKKRRKEINLSTDAIILQVSKKLSEIENNSEDEKLKKENEDISKYSEEKKKKKTCNII